MVSGMSVAFYGGLRTDPESTQKTIWSRKDCDASGYGRTGGSFLSL